MTKTVAQEQKNKEKQTEKEITVVKRNGIIVPFRRERIFHAIEAAFRDTKKTPLPTPLPEEMKKTINDITDRVTKQLLNLAKKGVSLSVEGIQDIVEITLMKTGHHDVARDYIIYRDKHKILREDSPYNLKISRRSGRIVRFNPMKIAASIEKIFYQSKNTKDLASEDTIELVNALTQKIVNYSMAHAKKGGMLSVDFVQDKIEETLMKDGLFTLAKEYILYRQERGTQSRFESAEGAGDVVSEQESGRNFTVEKEDGSKIVLTESQLRKKISYACRDLEEVSAEEILERTILNFYEGIKESEVDTACIMATKSLIEKDPAYSKVAARLLLDILYREAMQISADDPELLEHHKSYFKNYIKKGVSVERLSPELLHFDLNKLSEAFDLSRDDDFKYLGLQTLYDRYFIHHEDKRLETPQIFWMRVAMGLSLKEDNKEERAIEFYHILSQFYYVSATPTLFNSGTCHSQLSSCYLSTVMDDLHHIYKVIADDAQLSKWAGGLGNDWTNVRATGSMIKGTNGRSQGVIPFLKVANDTAVAVNQGGKRKGAMCAYLEAWHLDIEDFLELRKNTGDERRRTHDMNTANWIPDLFMKRVMENEKWTLFSPSDVPDLHDLYGEAFEKRYKEYEKMAREGKLKLHKEVDAVMLWRKMLSMLFETGHPWITFKDPSNIRSPQDHKGVVHSSNLCTEILLNTSEEEVAVCNLGSVNLVKHMKENGQGLDEERLSKTVRTAIRMLDNVIDINFYPIKEAQTSNARHRPIGLGIMGFQDALFLQNISYASHDAVEFADRCQEMVSYYAILASSELAKERGVYESYKGSKWERGYLPIDTLDLLEKQRGGFCEIDRSSSMDWKKVRQSIKNYGMRNSNTMAIAPTATIANIAGVTSSIEPTYKHLFVKSNLSGEFTISNEYLVDSLKKIGLWDDQMIDDLKYFDGSIAEIERIPESLKKVYLTAFEIDPDWLIECGSRRQKWIDMGQSLNLYLAEASGKKLDQMYKLAWVKGLKTTYYLRALGATQIEKSTTDVNKRGLQPRWMKNKSPSSSIQVQREEKAPIVCNLEEGCESCQ
ncbi:MAG: ribonucleoside-diphosphate reductase subunit alpha [Simkaniaceae bacterium]